MSEKHRMSISQIDMLSRCGEQYRRRYIQGERIPPGIALLVGRAVDESVGANLGRKLQKSPLMSLEEVADITADRFNNQWSRTEVKLDEEEAEIGVAAAKGNGLDKSIRLATLHASEIAPVIEPTHLQRKVVVELPDFPHNLIGFIDIQEGRRSIRDTKTSGKTPAKNIAEKNDQLTMYAMMSLVADKTIPENLYLDYLIDLKQPKAQTFGTRRDREDFKPLLRRLEVASLALEKGVFLPARDSDWWCDERWCGYWTTCPYVKRNNRPKS